MPSTSKAAAVRTPDASSFLNWAESAYPNYFPTSESNKSIDVWTYRYYPKTDIYLGTNTTGDVLGLVGMAVTMRIDYSLYRRLAYPILGLSTTLLAAVLVVGVRVNGVLIAFAITGFAFALVLAVRKR